jgi:hypothetical protein
MPELTRKRVHEQPECWHIDYDGVRVGTIAHRSGNPRDTDRWRWSCGFYPGGHPGDDRSGTAPTFDAARAAFAAAWRDYLPKRTPGDFEECRRHDVYTAEKYAEWDRRAAAARVR